MMLGGASKYWQFCMITFHFCNVFDFSVTLTNSINRLWLWCYECLAKKWVSFLYLGVIRSCINLWNQLSSWKGATQTKYNLLTFFYQYITNKIYMYVHPKVDMENMKARTEDVLSSTLLSTIKVETASKDVT